MARKGGLTGLANPLKVGYVGHSRPLVGTSMTRADVTTAGPPSTCSKFLVLRAAHCCASAADADASSAWPPATSGDPMYAIRMITQTNGQSRLISLAAPAALCPQSEASC